MSTKVEGQTLRQNDAKPNFRYSQSPTNFSIINLLNTICDGLNRYKFLTGDLYSVLTALEFPECSSNRIMAELKIAIPNVDESEILNSGFKFCAKK